MGAKTWMLVYSEGDIPSVLRAAPPLDRAATRQFVESLHRDMKLHDKGERTLYDLPNPPDELLYATVFPGVRILATGEAGKDYPSKIDRRFIEAAGKGTLTLHAMHSVVDWFAYAIWRDGKLVRALSVSPDSGILENIGTPLPFEEPYWAGKHPVEPAEASERGEDDEDDGEKHALPFHPLDLAEEALRALFGFVYEGVPLESDPDLSTIQLAVFEIERPSFLSRVRSWFGG